jgi:hypothetical protein
VFIAKANELIHDLVKKQVMGPVVGWCYALEHQKRGMPHLHILLMLKKSPVLDSPEFVNDYISAEIPVLPEDDDQSEQAEQQRRLYHLITNHNLHDCTDESGCRETKNGKPTGKCKKRFPKVFSDQTILSGKFLCHKIPHRIIYFRK